LNCKIAIIVFCIVASICAGEKNYAFEGSVGLAIKDGLKTYVPIPSISFFWIKSKGMHELSAEFFTKTESNTNSMNNKETAVALGITYAFLFKLPIKFIYIGPTFGIINYWSSKTTYYNSVETYSTFERESGQYFCGCKTCFIFGENTIRFKIQDRLLFGINNNDYPTGITTGYGAVNNICVGILIAL
jgi:hypothetical protein